MPGLVAPKIEVGFLREFTQFTDFFVFGFRTAYSFLIFNYLTIHHNFMICLT